MKLSDYIADFLAQQGVTRVFGMSGGAAVHMFDSFHKHPAFEIVCSTHEQCAAIEADGYARASGRLGVAVTTSGPGATNLLTGTCCSYYDSVATLMLTGQVASHRLKGERQVRQVGFQETDVVSIFKSITKYAVQLTDPKQIRYHLEAATWHATEGRPGPVLIDIPDDFQRVEIEPAQLPGFTPPLAGMETAKLDAQIDEMLAAFAKAKRPVIVLGGGLKTPFCGSVLRKFIDTLQAPVILSWAAVDLLPYEHPLRIGTFGVYSPRPGNFTAQNADLILLLGTRLSQNLTGGKLDSFAPGATIFMVDTDPHEMSKFDGRGITIAHRLESALAPFLDKAAAKLTPKPADTWADWKTQIAGWRKSFASEKSFIGESPVKSVDAYDFLEKLSAVMAENELIYVDTGGNLTWTCNGLRTKDGQAVFSAWNNTPMGYALPAAIGGASFDNTRPVTCLIGDGGLALCLGEMSNLAAYNFSVKVVLFNNHGHAIQKQTLETWLGGTYVGVDPSSGLAFPDFVGVARAMNLPVHTIDNPATIAAELQKIYAQPGPAFINVEINPNQRLYPFLKFGASLDNQTPPVVDPA